MDLRRRLESISSIQIPVLESGHCSTIEEFFNSCTSPNLPDLEVVVQWNNLLYEYVQKPDAIFFIRRYASAPGKDWLQIRRGFITEYSDESGYVFCDNFFAHYIFAMALAGFVPSLEEFYLSIKGREFPYGFMRTKEELPLQAYPKGKSPKLNDAGWKLAHLYSVNKDDYSFDYKGIIDDICPRGSRSDWRDSPNGSYPSRYINRGMNSVERDVFTTHFLRLASPMNYFLVPKQTCESDSLGGNIGEASELLNYVYAKFRSRYGDEFSLFRSKIKDKGNYENRNDFSCATKKIDIAYSLKLAKNRRTDAEEENIGSANQRHISKPHKRKPAKSSAKQGVTIEQLHKMARLYLEYAVSFRGLERKVLGIDSKARGGGWIAKSSLNDFGITAENKGALSRVSLKEEINSATGKYRLALLEVYRDEIDWL